MTISPIPWWLQPTNPLVDERCHFIGPTIDPDTRVELALTNSSLRTSAKAMAENLTEGGGAAVGAEVIQGLLTRNR